MNKMKLWAVLYLLSFALLVATIVVLALGIMDAFEWHLALLIPLIFLFAIGLMVLFAKMYYDLGEWYDMGSFCWLFLKFFISAYGGLGIWGIVVAIQILCGRKE